MTVRISPGNGTGFPLASVSIGSLMHAVGDLGAKKSEIRTLVSLPFGFALDLGMNLAPVRVEHGHGDDVRR